MDADSGNRFAVPLWLWVATAIALVAILGAVMWTALSAPEGRVDANQTPYIPPDGDPMGAAPRGSYTTPPPVSPPVLGRSVARVTVTPIAPPRPLASPQRTQTAPAPAPKPVAAKPRDGSVQDMFPMERIGAGPAATRETPPAPKPDAESFPQVVHGGRAWAFTGKFVSAGKVDGLPVGTDSSDRAIYTLAGAAGTVLFVQSRTSPGRLAVYR